jgi:hypothetical protein
VSDLGRWLATVTRFVGNSSTDFDAYYAGVLGEGPKRPMPRKFLKDPLTGLSAKWLNSDPGMAGGS